MALGQAQQQPGGQALGIAAAGQGHAGHVEETAGHGQAQGRQVGPGKELFVLLQGRQGRRHMGHGGGNQHRAVQFVLHLLLQLAPRLVQPQQLAGGHLPGAFQAPSHPRIELFGVLAVEQRLVQGEGFGGAEPALFLDQLQGGLQAVQRPLLHQRPGLLQAFDDHQQIGPHGGLGTAVVKHLRIDPEALPGQAAGRRQLPPPRSLAGQRFWVDSQVLDDSRTQAAVRANLLVVIESLQQAGALVEQRPLHSLQATLQLIQEQGWLGAAEAFALHQPLLDSEYAEQLDPRVRRRLESARQMPASQLLRLYQARRQLQQQVQDELDGAVLITPTVAHVAPPLAPLEQDEELFARTNLATLRLTMPGSFLDMPGVALPSGRDAQGLPTGLLLSLPQGHDRQLLDAALALEAALPR